jgi:hypothetical protein
MFSAQGDSTAVLLGLMLYQGWDEYVYQGSDALIYIPAE